MTNPATPDPTHFRALARRAVSLPGALRGVEAPAQRQREVKVLDLGLGGACLELSEVLAIGAVVELLIDAPRWWDPLTLRGVVRWARSASDSAGPRWLVGLCFQHVNGGSIRALTELLETEAFG